MLSATEMVVGLVLSVVIARPYRLRAGEAAKLRKAK